MISADLHDLSHFDTINDSEIDERETYAGRDEDASLLSLDESDAG